MNSSDETPPIYIKNPERPLFRPFLHPQPHKCRYIKNSGINFLSLCPYQTSHRKKGFLQQKSLMNAKGRLQKGLYKRFVESRLVSCTVLCNFS